MTISFEGFSNLVRKGLEVQVASELVVNLQLQLGSATEKVEVVAEAPLVDAASSATGAVNYGQTVRELPMNGRDRTTLAALQLSETFNVQFRAELFNVMNHTNISPPSATNSQVFSQTLAPLASAGTLTATSTTSRQIQFAMKVIW